MEVVGWLISIAAYAVGAWWTFKFVRGRTGGLWTRTAPTAPWVCAVFWPVFIATALVYTAYLLRKL